MTRMLRQLRGALFSLALNLRLEFAYCA